MFVFSTDLSLEWFQHVDGTAKALHNAEDQNTFETAA